jgi:hypothetical protein
MEIKYVRQIKGSKEYTRLPARFRDESTAVLGIQREREKESKNETLTEHMWRASRR